MKKIFSCLFIFLGLSANSQDLETGLIGHWPFDGNAIDFSSGGNNGQIQGALPVQDRFGREAKALFFDGNRHISLGNIINLGYGNMSISSWYKIDPNNKKANAIVAKSYPSSSKINRYAVGIENGRIRVLFDYNQEPHLDFTGNSVTNDGEWHHLVVTFDRNNKVVIYSNGIGDGARDISSSEGLNVNSSYEFLLAGYNNYNSYRFKGIIDDIRIYNRVLTPAEVEALYNLPSESSGCTNLITGINGNVGIGTDNSGDYGLAIGGSIYTDEVRVMNVDTWPDYVFSESYSLMELEDVASYIQQYAHLPGLPSAKEVFDDGISLTQMDKANLKKLEELSLYLLDQHARMKSLRSSKGEKASVLSNRSDREKANNFVFEQFRMKEGQGQLMALPTDSLSIRNMYCQGDNVGINTSDTGGYRLGVTGGILSEGVKVESISNWPDYVFSADYSLRSLDELEAYIEANRHLPGLPSANAIESDGYSLSEMDRLLMEKVEELTLYIIDQDRHLTELSKELGIDFPTKSHKWPSTSENLLAENSGSHYKDYTKKEVQILAEVSGTFTSPLCDAISCNGEEVGIGTDPLEGYLLAVAGGILTDDIRVASVSNWPDYVFEADYKLRELSGLSAYIEREGHLPGVPKAEVVEQEGYHLETMDALLLEKIEELTLYLIGQERELTFLEEHSVKQ